MCSRGKLLLTFVVLGISLITLGAVLGFIVFENIIEDQIIESVQLKKGTEQYERWVKLPFPLKFKVYLFHVTNPDAVMKGAVTHVEERGPYVYNVYLEKQDITYNEESDILSYTQNRIFKFDEEASAPLLESDTLVMLNVPLQAAFQHAEGSSGLSTVVDSNWKSAFPDTQSLFHEVTVKDYLFQGYKFCDPSTNKYNLLCKTMRTMVPTIKTLSIEEATDMLVFSFFNFKNDTNDGEYEITAGLKDIHQVGAIRRWNGEEFLTYWSSEESVCNKIRGRDSTVYPPFNNDTSAYDILNTDICRIVKLEYSGNSEYKGIDGQVNKLSRNALSNTGENSCYCINQTRNLQGETVNCLPEGFGDMYNCIGAPVIISYPHLAWSDESYARTVKGLKSDPDKHTTFINIEPGTGFPLEGSKRIQFNMFIRPIDKITITEEVPLSVMPLLWVEESVQLTDDLVEQLKDEYLNKLVILDVVTWVLIGIGAAVGIISLVFYIIKK